MISYQTQIENIREAFRSIKAYKLRAVLTVLIIAFGIMALVGILTAIDAIKLSIRSNFTSLGANTFTIRNRGLNVRIGNSHNVRKTYPAISYKQALEFTKEYTYPSWIAISAVGDMASEVVYGNKKTNPNMQLVGGDENYLIATGLKIAMGRNFSSSELHYAVPVCIIGYEILKVLFNENAASAIGQVIHANGLPFQVVGVLEYKGSSFSFSGDRTVLIPLTALIQRLPDPGRSFVINVTISHAEEMDRAIDEAIVSMRKVRKLRPGDENSFEIIKSDSLSGLLIENLSMVTLAATFIGLITLLGAAIGLMNIMLVSVTERTREIGTRKALGATQALIKNQFLTESVLICQIGGIVGVLLGIVAGNVISWLIGSAFIIPWAWIALGLLLCWITGILSGYYPAQRAARLDPIEALRYE